MTYLVIYDGDCNLCAGLVQLLERLDQGRTFAYSPMQNAEILARFQLAIADMVLGVMLIDLNCPSIRWQGSSAIEEIAKLLPNAAPFVHLYLQIKPIKWLGDRTYEQIRNHRYALFGKRSHTFVSEFAPICAGDRCQRLTLPQGVG
jgi:predicted DCC family thiol-disulfide oxidoreductase YuxK